MKTENIRVEKRGSVAMVTLDRPKVLNALNAATFTELDAVFDELASDGKVRVVLVTGAGERAFAAGADFPNLRLSMPVRGKHFRFAGRPSSGKLKPSESRSSPA